jgi:hypothetical protein
MDKTFPIIYGKGIIIRLDLLTLFGYLWYATPKVDKYRLKGRTKPIKTDKPSVDRIKAKGATFKIWNHSLFYKHLGAYAGVIGFLFIINMLTWNGMIWFHWPALGWGLLLFFHWIKVTKNLPIRKS